MSVTTIGKANFEKEVLQSDLPVMVDFWAPWCGYCRRLSPVVDQLDGAYEGRLVIGKINIDDEPELAEKYTVETIPADAVPKGKGTRSDYRSPVQRPGNGMAEGKRCGIKRPC